MSKVNNAQLQDILEHIGNNRFIPQMVQHFDKSMVFSTDEVMVGQWINNYPVYKKTLTFTVPTTTADGTASSALNIPIGASVLGIVDMQFIMYIDGFGWNNDWANAVASNKVNKVILLPYCNANATAAKRNTVDITNYQRVASGANGYLTLYYTKSTDTALSYKIEDANVYSAQETLVGKWFGENLYQKSIIKNWHDDIAANPSDYSRTVTTDAGVNQSSFITDIQNASNARVKEVFCRKSKLKWNPLVPHTGDYSATWNFNYTGASDTGGIWVTDDAKYVFIDWNTLPYENTFDDDDSEFIITLQYTKTA